MKYSNGTSIKVNRKLRVSPAAAFDIVYNIENFPTFMPHIQSVKILSDAGARKQAVSTEKPVNIEFTGFLHFR